jgi:hypothetical protein
VSNIGPTGPVGVPGRPAPYQNGHLVRKFGMQGVASLLRISNQQLVRSLNSGQSLAQIPTANGKTPDQGAQAFAAGVQCGVNAAGDRRARLRSRRKRVAHDRPSALEERGPIGTRPLWLTPLRRPWYKLAETWFRRECFGMPVGGRRQRRRFSHEEWMDGGSSPRQMTSTSEIGVSPEGDARP